MQTEPLLPSEPHPHLEAFQAIEAMHAPRQPSDRSRDPDAHVAKPWAGLRELESASAMPTHRGLVIGSTRCSDKSRRGHTPADSSPDSGLKSTAPAPVFALGSAFCSDHLLQNLFVQGEVRDQPLQARVSSRICRNSRASDTPRWPYFFFQR
jgi:hypothetical protein